jgi:hypothetical protein
MPLAPKLFGLLSVIILGVLDPVPCVGAEITVPKENLSKVMRDEVSQKGNFVSSEGNPNRCDVRLVGKIGFGTAKQFADIFRGDENEFEGHAATLCLDSTGGEVEEALEIARFIRDKADAITTVVQNGAVCKSACALIFLAGRERSRLGPQPGRYLEPQGRLSLHPTFFPKISDQKIDELLKSNQRDQLLSEFYSKGLSNVQQIIDTYRAPSWFADYAGKPFTSPSLFLEVFSQSPDEWLCIDTIDKVGRWNIRLLGYDKTAVSRDQKYYNACRNIYLWTRDENASNSYYFNGLNTVGKAKKISSKKTIV